MNPLSLRQSLETQLHQYHDHLLHEQMASEHTVSNYARDIRQFIAFVPEDVSDSIGEITYPSCKQFVRGLHEDGNGARSVHRKVAALRSFWAFMLATGVCVSSPWDHVILPKLPSHLPTVLDSEDMLQFLNSIDTHTVVGQRDRAIVELIYASGLRVSEVVGIVLGDIDLDSGEIRVMGKGSKERIVLFNDIAKQHLDDYIRFVRPLWLKENTDALFLNQRGGPLTVRSVQRLIKQYAQAAGLEERVTPHTLRHSFASDLYAGGATLEVIQTLLGHENISTTQIYTHLSDERLLKTFHQSHPRA